MVETQFGLSGKRALITGGANGLGRMIAEGYLRAGAEVIITSRRLAVTAAREMSSLGPCTGIEADLTSAGAARGLAAEVRALTQELHIIINNAGRTWGEPFETFSDRGWAPVFAVNVQAPFVLAQELLPLLIAAARPDDPARVINIGSAAGHVVERLGAFSYAASKAAVAQLSRQLAAELAIHHITVNTIVPGYFPTAMTAHIREDSAKSDALIAHIPMRRLGRAEDISGLAIFLGARAAAYITGATIPVDGGLTGCR